MTKNYTFSEFKDEYREEINEIIIITLKHIDEKRYNILDRQNLLKHLVEYIYITSDYRKLNV